MLTFKADLRLNVKKDALVASVATFVLSSFFFVMAFVLYPAMSLSF
jgi:hypothetical protein